MASVALPRRAFIGFFTFILLCAGLHVPAAEASSSWTSRAALPFAPGAAVEVSQGPNMPATSPWSHYGTYNWSAVDFAPTTTRTPVYASQNGYVWYEGWGAYSGINNAAAGIEILLNVGGDNCLQYAHLSGTVINTGDRVLRGQLLGYTGSTGNSSGEHLHWAGVSCTTQKATFIPNTSEFGTSYPNGAARASQNNGADLLNPQSKRCVDVSGASTKPGAAVQLWDCNGTKAQRWVFSNYSYVTGYGELRAFAGTRCLDVSGGNLSSGTVVQSWTCNGTKAQKWRLNRNGTINTVNGLCLDARSGGRTNGTRLQVYRCNGTGSQLFG